MAKKIKSNLHPRSKHREQYDFDVLSAVHAELKRHVQENAYGSLSIKFFDPSAVKALNTALIKHYYDLEYWDIPQGYLCPAVPGRADYIHYVADLFSEKKRRTSLRCFDLGVGANCVYPIIGTKEYGWHFTASDIDETAIRSAKKIVQKNVRLQDKIVLRMQRDERFLLKDILGKKEHYDLLIANPPFHASKQDADKAARRKLKNLKGKPAKEIRLNFEGQSNELWTEGGELRFIRQLIDETSMYRESFHWCTSLVSKETTLNKCLRKLEKKEVSEKRIIEMGTANKKTRILAWQWK